MKPILVIVHVYYMNLWNELKGYLKSIKCPYDLYVTTSVDDTELKNDILNFNQDAHVVLCENLGYDIWPFVHVINGIDLDKYSYIIKLHTKRDIKIGDTEFRELDGAKWRDALLSFLKSPATFQKYLDAFELNPHIGIQNNCKVIVKHDFYDKIARRNTKKWILEHGLPNIKFSFVGGTMFIARASIFKDLQLLNIASSNFEKTSEKHNGQFAHIVERLFGYLAYKNNFIVSDGNLTEAQNLRYQRIVCLKRILRFFFFKKITRRGWLLIKICKIPIPVDVEHEDNNVKYRIHKIPLTVFEVENKKDKRIYKIFGIPCFFKNIGFKHIICIWM